MLTPSGSFIRRGIGVLLLSALAAGLFLLAATHGEPRSNELVAAERAGSREAARGEVSKDPETSPSLDSTPSRRAAFEHREAPASPPGKVVSDMLTGLVRASEGQAISGALCQLFPGRDVSGFGEGSGASVIATALSGLGGRFQLGAGAGPLLLVVRAAGYATWTADHLRPGDDLVVTLVPAVRLSVLVRDDRGKAVPGVELRATDAYRDLTAPVLAESVSDALGTAVLRDLAPGNHYLVARHPDHELLFVAFSLAEGSGAGELELTLRRGVRLAGTVRVAEGVAAPAGTLVRVEAFSKGQSLILEVPCDSEGRFATEALLGRGETLVATARAPGFAEQRLQLRIAAAAVGEQRIEFLLEPAGRRATGRAIGTDGRPLPGVSVRVTSIAPVPRGMEGLGTAMVEVSAHAERWRVASETDANGRYHLTGLAADREYLVRLAESRCAPGLVWVPKSEPGAEIELGDVALVPAGSLSGFVRDASGAPESGAQLRAIFETVLTGNEYELDRWRPSRWWRPLSVTSDSTGAFRFDALAAGSYTVQLDGTPVGNWYVPAGGDPGPLELVATAAASTTMQVIEGSVTGEGELPLANALVALFAGTLGPTGWLEPTQPDAVTLTDYRGGFKLRAPADVEYTLQVTDLHGVYLDHFAALLVDDRTEYVAVQLELDPGSAEPLMGRVLGPDGVPLAGIDVALVPPENAYCGCLSFLARTDEDGLVIFERVSRQDHQVVVSDPVGRYRPMEHGPLRPGGYFEVVLGL